MGQQRMFRQNSFGKYLNLAAAGLVTKQSRRNHPGIVEYQQIIGLQQGEDIAETGVAGLAVTTVKHQQAGSGALW